MWSSGLTQNLANDHAHFSISVFVAVLCLCIVIGQLLEQNRWINESITAILMIDFGFVFGGSHAYAYHISGTIILLWSKGTNSHIVRFDEELFFIYLLPPIIFNAGFQVKKKQFFRNFLTIMLFGVVGVFISSAIISAGSWWLFPKIGFSGLLAKEYLAIGTIFSSTDTVCTLQVLNQDETPLLYSLVFGEGVVNDATSVVLFNAVQKLVVSRLDGWAAVHVFGDFLYLFLTSTVLGVAAGLLTAYAIRSLYLGIQLIVKFSLMVLIAYLSYMLAELLHLSGILTVFFCGIVMSHYALHNLTENSRITTRHTFATMSFIAETFIFLYVGMDALDIEKWKMSKTSFKTSMGLCCSIILLILLGRAAFVFPLSALSNYMNKSAESKILIWWAGLMRGAVSIALAFNQFTFSGITWNPVHATMVNSTVIVVLFTTLVFSLFTKPLINVLLPHHARDNHHNQVPNSAMEELELPLLNFEESATENILRAKSSISMLIERPVYTIHSYWRKFGDAYMRPVFGGPR